MIRTCSGVQDGSAPRHPAEVGVSFFLAFNDDNGVPLLATVAGDTAVGGCLFSLPPLLGDSD